MNDELDKILIDLLHKHDHESDEITKYVVIDQAEFVPDIKQALLQREAKLVRAARIEELKEARKWSTKAETVETVWQQLTDRIAQLQSEVDEG